MIWMIWMIWMIYRILDTHCNWTDLDARFVLFGWSASAFLTCRMQKAHRDMVSLLPAAVKAGYRWRPYKETTTRHA